MGSTPKELIISQPNKPSAICPWCWDITWKVLCKLFTSETPVIIMLGRKQTDENGKRTIKVIFESWIDWIAYNYYYSNGLWKYFFIKFCIIKSRFLSIFGNNYMLRCRKCIQEKSGCLEFISFADNFSAYLAIYILLHSFAAVFIFILCMNECIFILWVYPCAWKNNSKGNYSCFSTLFW